MSRSCTATGHPRLARAVLLVFSDMPDRSAHDRRRDANLARVSCSRYRRRVGPRVPSPRGPTEELHMVHVTRRAARLRAKPRFLLASALMAASLIFSPATFAEEPVSVGEVSTVAGAEDA